MSATAPRMRRELVGQRIELASERLANLWRLAGLAHPERPLQRGFVRVTDREGRTLVHAGDARSAGFLNLRFADGAVSACAGEIVSPEGRRRAGRRVVDNINAVTSIR